mmetsp:Transcript_10672/g.31984  ORF Transcript_10672/g.31984 Transcript_10672/m.31984 type:complete len:99 (-) Transcript_10672:184-480(-)
MSAWLVNADDTSDAAMIMQTQPLIGYDYDTCGSNGGWGSNSVPGDGCYSPVQQVNRTFSPPVLQSATGLYVEFRFQNNRRNMHLNDDGMNLQIRAHQC